MSELPETVATLLQSSHTETYVSDVPEAVKQDKENTPVIVGVDEAGRGPIFGSMVYCAAYVPVSFSECLNSSGKENLKYGFDDSKKLTDVKRDELFGYIWRQAVEGSAKSGVTDDAIKRLKENTGYILTGISARDISSGMMRYPPTEVYNLNQQAHDTTIAMIRRLKEEVELNIDHVFIDTVGPPASYQKKLETLFPDIKFTVSKKADSIYPIVSVASVIAKVTRDIHLSEISRASGAVGSGYPSDPNTVRFLKNNVTPLVGWEPTFTRFSWNTTNSYLTEQNEKYGTLSLKWEEEYITTGKKRSKKDAPAGPTDAEKRPVFTTNTFYDI